MVDLHENAFPVEGAFWVQPKGDGDMSLRKILPGQFCDIFCLRSRGGTARSKYYSFSDRIELASLNMNDKPSAKRAGCVEGLTLVPSPLKRGLQKRRWMATNCNNFKNNTTPDRDTKLIQFSVET